MELAKHYCHTTAEFRRSAVELVHRDHLASNLTPRDHQPRSALQSNFQNFMKCICSSFFSMKEQVINLLSSVIGIKYGPEGRVANKAEELMSTRSRRKAPRTG